MEKINLTNLILFSSEDRNREVWNLRAVPLYKVWRVYIEWNDFSTYYNEGNEFSVYCLLDISNWMFSWYLRLSGTSHLIPLPNEVTSTISALPFLIPFPNLVTGIILYLVTQIIYVAVILDSSKQSLSFPGGSVVKNLPANAEDIGDMGSIPGLGRSPGEGNGNPLQYFCLGNPMDRVDWWATVHGVTKSLTQLSD